MKIPRLSSLAILAFAAGAGALLFWTSQNVQEKESALRTLEQAVAKERQSIRVLNAEWDYLNRPERLESLASTHMGLAVPQAAQVNAGAAGLPAPFSLIPPVKPDFTGRLTEPPLPAVYSPLSSPSVPPPALKKPLPPSEPSSSSRTFQSLMEDLGAGEKEAR